MSKPRLGIHDGQFTPCPNTPNCVSSDAPAGCHDIEAYRLTVSATESWSALRKIVAGLSRTRVVTVTDDYLHAECTIAVFGFVDDIEFHLRPEQGIIAVRSASRVGRWDLGVNRRRVERIRRLLRDRGVVE